MRAGLIGSGPVAAWWAANSLDQGAQVGTWYRDEAPPAPPGHPAEPCLQLGPPPPGVPAHPLATTLHRGKRELRLLGGPGRWLEGLQGLGAPPAPLADLLLAAHARQEQAHGWRAGGSALGLPLSTGAGWRDVSIARAYPGDWARWLDLPLLAAGVGGPEEAGVEALLVLLGAEGIPWVLLGAESWERAAMARWEASGGAIEPVGQGASGPAAPGPWLGCRMGWPARRFVQVVGRAPAEHNGHLHVWQVDEGLPAREENLVVALVRPPDVDCPAAKGRRALAGAWFDEEWWSPGVSFPAAAVHARLATAAERFFPGFDEEALFVPPGPTRWDGAWGRPAAVAHFGARRLALGQGLLGVAGLPSACHLSALASAEAA